jgi:hypothetical protein
MILDLRGTDEYLPGSRQAVAEVLETRGLCDEALERVASVGQLNAIGRFSAAPVLPERASAQEHEAAMATVPCRPAPVFPTPG